MKKTMIYLPNDIHEGLRRLAFEQRSSIAEMVRQAVEVMYGDEIAAAQPATKPAAAAASSTVRNVSKGKKVSLTPMVTPLRRATAGKQPVPHNRAVLAELYLRRLPVDEAIYQLDEYLDDAFMSGHLWVRIIHGKGTGTLRKAIWDRLRNHSLVKSYHLADPGEGDAGVTVVQMAER